MLEQVKGGLIVSCQALPDEPLHSSFIMGRMALVFFMEQFCKYDPILLIPVKLALTRLPFVIAGTVDPHDST